MTLTGVVRISRMTELPVQKSILMNSRFTNLNAYTER